MLCGTGQVSPFHSCGRSEVALQLGQGRLALLALSGELKAKARARQRETTARRCSPWSLLAARWEHSCRDPLRCYRSQVRLRRIPTAVHLEGDLGLVQGLFPGCKPLLVGSAEVNCRSCLTSTSSQLMRDCSQAGMLVDENIHCTLSPKSRNSMLLDFVQRRNDAGLASVQSSSNRRT